MLVWVEVIIELVRSISKIDMMFREIMCIELFVRMKMRVVFFLVVRGNI